MQIGYDLEILTQKHVNIEEQVSKITDIISALDVALGDLSDYWKGQASSAYEADWQERRAILIEFKEMLENADQNLINIINAQSDNDHEIANQF